MHLDFVFFFSLLLLLLFSLLVHTGGSTRRWNILAIAIPASQSHEHGLSISERENWATFRESPGFLASPNSKHFPAELAAKVARMKCRLGPFDSVTASTATDSINRPIPLFQFRSPQRARDLLRRATFHRVSGSGGGGSGGGSGPYFQQVTGRGTYVKVTAPRNIEISL